MPRQPWESTYTPGLDLPSIRSKRRAEGDHDPSMLDLAEDGHAHPITPATVMFVPVDEMGDPALRVRAFARQHRIRVVNYGRRSDGVAVTLASRREAAKMLLLWDDPVWECKVPR
jgi:hypothetical protein